MFSAILRLFLISIVLLLLVSTTGCSLLQRDSRRVLVIIQEYSDDMDFMLENEVGVITAMLENSGYKAVTASLHGELVQGANKSLTPDMKLADVDMKDFDGLIDPCMARDLTLSTPTEEIAVIQQAADLGKPIAAQLGGVYALKEAGILDGKKFALFDEPDEFFNGSVYEGTGIVQDGIIITSGVCPYMARMSGMKDGTSELVQKFIDTLQAN